MWDNIGIPAHTLASIIFAVDDEELEGISESYDGSLESGSWLSLKCSSSTSEYQANYTYLCRKHRGL